MEAFSIPDGAEALLTLGRAFVTAAQRMVATLQRAHNEHDGLPGGLEAIRLTLPIVTAQIENSMSRMQSKFWSARNNELLHPIYVECQKIIMELTGVIEDMQSEKEATNSDRVANTIRLNLVQESKIKKISGCIAQLSHSLNIHNAEVLVDVSLAKPKPRGVRFGDLCVHIPYERNEDFVGRYEILEEIDEKLLSRRQVVLSGLGGIGKTEIASEFCWRHHKKYPHSHIFWLTASCPSSIREGYQGIARRVGLPYGRPEFDNIVFETVADWLRRDENQPWLIVLDNADDLDTLKGGLIEKAEGYRSYLSSMPYRLGARNGKTIITTRNSQICRQVSRPGHISVPGLPTDDAVKLLRNQMSDDSLNKEQLEDVVTKLNQLPLAIAQAARYIIETDDTMMGYLRKLEDYESRANLLMEDFGSDRRDSHQKNSVFGTWEMSFEQVQRIRPRAAEMLSFMSVLAPQLVPKQLLQLKGENEVQFDMAVATLLSFSLVKKGSNSDELQMHPLIHEATRMWIGRSLEGVNAHKAAALRHIETHYPEIDHHHNADWDLIHSLEPHANEVLQYSFSGAEELPHAQLLAKSAGYDWSQGRSEEAQIKYLQALRIYERDPGQHALQVIRIFHALGNVLCDLGKYDESFRWLEKALDGVQALPIEHGAKSLYVCLLPSHITNSFGLLYKDQDLDEEAEQYFKKAHYLAEQVVGPEHPHTLISATNLAGVLRNQYRYEEAYHLHNDLIQRQKKVLGLENSVTLASMENFVYLLSDLRRYDEAMKMHQQLEYGKEAVYGRSHRHELIRNKEALAYILECRADHDQGDHQRTLELRQEAYDAFKAHYGEDHEYTLDAGQQTARIMWRLKNVAAAEELGRRVHQAMERRFGHDHSQTLSTFGEVITYVREQGRYEEAERMRRRQLATLEEKRGDNDLEVFHCCASLGNTIQHQYKYHEAIPFFQRAYDGFCRKLGEDHDEAKECLRKLELARSNLEKEKEGLGTAPASDEDDLAESLVTLVEEDEPDDNRGSRSVDGSIAESFPISPTLDEADIERYFREGFNGFVTYV